MQKKYWNKNRKIKNTGETTKIWNNKINFFKSVWNQFKNKNNLIFSKVLRD